MELCCSRFTAAEGGARLAAAAGEKNILAVEYASFVATRLVHEDAFKIRGTLSSGRQRSVFVCRASRVACVAYELQIMTDLKILRAVDYSATDWGQELEGNEVLVCTSEVLKKILEEETLKIKQVNVLIIDSCHLVCSDDNLQFIMKQYKQCPTESKPRILALTYPLFSPPTKESDLQNAKNTENDADNSENDKTDSENDKSPTENDKNEPENDKNEPENDKNEPENDKNETENVIKSVESELKKDLCEEIGANENLDDFETYEKLEWKIEELEKELCCEMDLAEDIDGGKRLSSTLSKPKELVIEYPRRGSSLPEAYEELDAFMRAVIDDAGEFISEHRYDPTEIYGEDMYEEFKNIPDPTIEPKLIFRQFLYVLDELGPYAADKAAFSLLAKLEKLKIKVPYERHFLLLCLCTSVFVKIRCYADFVFSKYESDWEKIKTFCTPKVLRFGEILQKFQPPESLKNTSENTNKMLEDIEKCDFVTLGNKIEDKVNTYESNLKDLDDVAKRPIESTGNSTDSVGNKCDSVENKENSADSNSNSSNSLENKPNKCVSPQNMSDSVENKCDTTGNKCDSAANKSDSTGNKCDTAVNKCDSASNSLDSGQKPFGFSRRAGGRVRGRGRSARSNIARVQQIQLNPDALCGIVFMKEALMAKIMFMLVVDMSRAHRSLSYLCAQYCAVETPADPATEAKECQRQGKKQEEVLKKFRMHECNLLLATSALEEGIDLPRCNLVLRWDVPQSYRSYGLCRGRARAPRAACGVLCCGEGDTTAGGDTDDLLNNLATYREIDQIISRKCGCGIQDEPPQQEEDHADVFNLIVKPYTPQEVTQKDIKTNKTEKIFSEINKDRLKMIVKDTKSNEVDKISSENEKNIDSKAIKDVRNDSENKNDSRNRNYSGNKNNSQKEAKYPIDIINGKDSLIKSIENAHKTDDIPNIVDSKLDERLADLKLGENNAKVVTDIDCNTQIICSNCESENKKDSEISENIKDSLRTDNLFCNRCSNMKTSISVECPCVKVGNISYIARNKSDSKLEKDSKKIADSDIASVDLNSAIALINRYCGKLPSDTFTRLAPQWWTEEVQLPSGNAFICTLRLPLNCPVKYNIVGHPMPTRVLARRMAALQACRILHKSGELDNQLMPIGKENFKAAELETPNPVDLPDSGDARPGTTKRRQYYYKRTAWAFTDCQPIVDASDAEIDGGDAKEVEEESTKKGTKRNMLYAIVSKLWCALPERYNTRGRRLHAPQNASQAIGILMARDAPDDLQIPAFPVYTRSGEVRVSVEYVPDADVRMSPRRGRLVRRFMRFVFAEVLRVRRKGMKLQSDASNQNNYYVVPTIKTTREDGSTKVDIDWAFLELIYQHTEDKKNSELEKPLLWQQDDEEVEEHIEKVEKEKDSDGKVKKLSNPLLKDGETFVFDAEKYREAVVTPWYRNQDQPQFFLVAEICWNLSPDSAFPSATHTSFRNYYSNKYGVVLTQPNQPLLDVDHTSARLNLLTPRYVNRKGVALPVSSERTRRAKRDRLDQKQILVPELCRVHPFAAPLWFATVALPCVLYRINALLIADEIRRSVAIDVGLGVPQGEAPWPPLDFGWSLAEVLSADSEKNEKKKDEEEKKEPLKESIDKAEVEDIHRVDEPKEKTINDILAEKEDAESGFEIGTWSNDMASSIPDSMEYDEFMEPLPSNLTFCTSASGGTNWCDPITKPKSQYNPSRTFSMADSDCSYMSSDFDTDDSDLNSDSDDDTENGGFWSKNSMGVRIEYKTAHEAEAVDVEKKKKTRPQPQNDAEDDAKDRAAHKRFIAEGTAPVEYIEQFRTSVVRHKEDLITKGNLIKKDEAIADILPETKEHKPQSLTQPRSKVLEELFPYGQEQLTMDKDGQISLESIERNKRVLLQKLKLSMNEEEIKKLQCFSMADVDIDSKDYVNEKVVNVGFDTKDNYVEKISKWDDAKDFKPYYHEGKVHGKEFDFDYQPVLDGHPGPSPSVILQALTMSNANDGINLERLETIGDSFLKFAITAYLYCAHPAVHEGKLSHMRSKQVSNLNLYRLGRSKRLGARMIASKFEPHDNWLPPCHKPPHTHASGARGENQEQTANSAGAPVDSTGCFIPYNLITQHSIPDKSIADCVEALIGAYLLECGPRGALLFMSWLGIRVLPRHTVTLPDDHPYVKAAELDTDSADKPELPTSPKHTHYDSDSDSDCSTDTETPRAQPEPPRETDWSWRGRVPGSLRPYRLPTGQWVQPVFGELKAPPSPLLRYIDDPEGELEQMLSGYDALERTLQYRFKDRSLLLQALTHASHQKNRLTDCYQRLEFLGDAILDYLITRHLYEDPRRHSPGALTDLRSALVNNTIFATLAARHGFHKYFRHMSPGLNEVLTKYVKIQEENGHSISEEHYLIQEDALEQAEDVEVPKALGDLFESVAGAIFLDSEEKGHPTREEHLIQEDALEQAEDVEVPKALEDLFESVAGAIFLDSGMSLGAVWKSYVNLMGAELEAFSAAAPKSPVRELLEAEPDTAKFGKPERLADGRRVRVCVEVFGRGAFKGVGRNYRIAKGTAARCALRHLRAHPPR